MSVVSKRLLPRKSKNEVLEADRRQAALNKMFLVLGLLVPGMVFFTIFLLMPVSNSLYYSLYDWNGMGPATDFVGLENYVDLIDHSVFQISVQHSLLIVALSVVVQLPLALALALLVGRGNLPGRGIFRTILFIPYVFSEILTAIMWMYIYNPRSGLLNTVINAVAPESEMIVWLADRNLALLCIFVVITWKYFGLHMILYMAALQGVPQDLEDAARIDGAKELDVLRSVTIPLIGPAIRLTVYLSVLGSFQQFVLVWILTEGGPANATHLIATYLYKFGIISVKLGYGSAIAVALFAITLSFSLFYQFFVMRRDYERA